MYGMLQCKKYAIQKVVLSTAKDNFEKTFQKKFEILFFRISIFFYYCLKIRNRR